jgi:O-antigen ligase
MRLCLSEEGILATSKKRRNAKDNQKLLNRYITGRFLISLVLSIIVGIIPLVLYFKKFTSYDPGYMFMDGQSSRLDIFSYYKMVLLILFSTLGLILFIYFRAENVFEEGKKLYYFPLGIYTMLVFLSAIFSEYKRVAFFGFIDRYEGGIVLIAYSVIMFLAMHVAKDEKAIKQIYKFLLGAAFIIALIGAFQYFGVDYFKSKLFLNLVTPKSLHDQISEIKSIFPEHTIASTLFNSNYVGSYMAMLLPINLLLLIHTKKIVQKGLLLIPLILIILNWIGCQSRAGIIGGVLALLIIAFMFRRKLLVNKVIAIVVTLLLCGSVFAVNFISGGDLFKKVASMISLEGKNSTNNSIVNNIIQDIVDIKMEHEKASIITRQGTLNISLPFGELKIFDERNMDIDIIPKDNIVYFNDVRFDKFKLNTNPDAGLIEIYYNEFKLINILFTKDGLKSNSNIWMTYRGNNRIETFGPSEMESLGSNRGYIWARTIPLLKKTIFLGHGPDTFPLYFPQYDYLGKLRMYQNGGIFVDKPHNLYLQTAVNTGVLSLLALLAAFGIYIVTSLRIYWNESFSTFLPVAGLSCLSAFLGYTASGIFNDSVISISPVFWVLFGLGAGINSMLYKNNLNNNSVKSHL